MLWTEDGYSINDKQGKKKRAIKEIKGCWNKKKKRQTIGKFKMIVEQFFRISGLHASDGSNQERRNLNLIKFKMTECFEKMYAHCK